MFELRLPVHSIIDVITNSSTEIFTFATKESITQIKDVVNTVLKAAKSEKTSDDLFDFDWVPSDAIIENEIEYVISDMNPCPKYGSQEYKDARSKLRTAIISSGKNYPFESSVPKVGTLDEDNLWVSWELEIKAKPNVELDADLVRMLMNIFETRDIQC